jgi:predicted acyltransferase
MGVYIVNTESGLSPGSGMSFNLYRILMIAAFFLIWNVYPKTEKQYLKHTFLALKITGLLLLLFLGIIFRDAHGVVLSPRWWGILGIIGWTYLICAFIYLFTRDRLKYLIPVWIFFVAICILQTPMKEGEPILNLPGGNFFNAMLNILHINNGALPAFTMGGIILSLISARYKNVNNSRKLVSASIMAILFITAGYITNQYWIISKLGETPPWVFYCTGIAIFCYSVIYWLDSTGKTAWTKIIGPAGTATLTCYLVPYVLYAIRFIESPEWFRNGFPGLINCILFSFFTIGVTYLLGRIHIKLKI